MEVDRLKNKKVWITGASKGIGLALTEELVDRVAALVASSSKFSTIRELSERFKSKSNFYVMPFDLANFEAVEEAAKRVLATVGDVDVLINNAGYGKFAPFEKLSSQDYEKTMAINFIGPTILTKAVLPTMLEKKEGVILNVLSVAGLKAFANSSAYGASKAALKLASESLREEVRARGVKIANVYPGATATEIWSPQNLEEFQTRMASPRSMARSILKILEIACDSEVMPEDATLRPQLGDL